MLRPSCTALAGLPIPIALPMQLLRSNSLVRIFPLLYFLLIQVDLRARVQHRLVKTAKDLLESRDRSGRIACQTREHSMDIVRITPEQCRCTGPNMLL